MPRPAKPIRPKKNSGTVNDGTQPLVLWTDEKLFTVQAMNNPLNKHMIYVGIETTLFFIERVSEAIERQIGALVECYSFREVGLPPTGRNHIPHCQSCPRMV